MTTRRAVTYGGLFCLLAAWLASAASTTLEYEQEPGEPQREAVGTSSEMLLEDVQANAARLRRRLASAPVPQRPYRNPFVFESRALQAPPPIARRVEPAAIPAPVAVPEPRLALIGIAADDEPNGTVRTAIIADDTEAVYMVTVGQTVRGQYRVEAISAEVVELKDVATNAVRRLALR